MGYRPLPGGAQAPPVPDIGYADADWPDPLADDETRFRRLAEAWDRLRAVKEPDMGYYRAGGTWAPPDFSGASADPMGLYSTSTALAPRQPEVTDLVTGRGYGTPPHDKMRRRMNPTNIRALRRSMRRVTSFAHIAKRVMSFTAHHKMKVRRKKRFGR